jgi:hypothetical protein
MTLDVLDTERPGKGQRRPALGTELVSRAMLGWAMGALYTMASSRQA